jgi:hypothetical protein
LSVQPHDKNIVYLVATLCEILEEGKEDLRSHRISNSESEMDRLAHGRLQDSTENAALGFSGKRLSLEIFFPTFSDVRRRAASKAHNLPYQHGDKNEPSVVDCGIHFWASLLDSLLTAKLIYSFLRLSRPVVEYVYRKCKAQRNQE